LCREALLGCLHWGLTAVGGLWKGRDKRIPEVKASQAWLPSNCARGRSFLLSTCHMLTSFSLEAASSRCWAPLGKGSWHCGASPRPMRTQRLPSPVSVRVRGEKQHQGTLAPSEAPRKGCLRIRVQPNCLPPCALSRRAPPPTPALLKESRQLRAAGVLRLREPGSGAQPGTKVVLWSKQRPQIAFRSPERKVLDTKEQAAKWLSVPVFGGTGHPRRGPSWPWGCGWGWEGRSRALERRPPG
jgi:hypothetical protein